MLIFLGILLGVVSYIVGAGATHGYAKHRWPVKMVHRYYSEVDDNESIRAAASILWPLYWVFIWPFTKMNEVTFSHIEKEAALHIARNKIRIADLQATREQLTASNAELEAAEVEVEKEMAKL